MKIEQNLTQAERSQRWRDRQAGKPVRPAPKTIRGDAVRGAMVREGISAVPPTGGWKGRYDELFFSAPLNGSIRGVISNLCA